MTKSLSKIDAILLAFIFFGPPLLVFQVLEADGAENINNQVDSSVIYAPSRSAENKSGKIRIVESESGYSHSLKCFGELPVKISLNSQYRGIDNSTGLEFPSSLTGISADIEATFPFFDVKDLYLDVNVIPSFYGDGWNFESSSFRVPSRYVAVYQTNDRLTWLGGVEIFPKYQDKVFPIFGVLYKPNDYLSIDINPDDSTVSYSLKNKITVFLESRFSLDEFVVERDNTQDVTLRYTETRLGTGVKFEMNKYSTASLSAGEILGNFLKYRDSEGKLKIKNGAYFGAEIEVDF